jgi:riboflavin kinase, archaea type
MINGKVTSGIGQGKQFMSIPEYLEQFQNKLGFSPFAGTLNIEIAKQLVLDKPFTTINGFEKSDKKFGYIKCFRAKIISNTKQENVIIIAPEKTQHSNNIVEIIHEKNLRESLHLNDGNRVKLEVLL